MTATTVHGADLHEPLELPEFEPVPLTREGWPAHDTSGFYGATAAAADYCGLARAPEHLRGEWQHGWNPSYRQPLPAVLILGTNASPERQYWVARKDEEECLRAQGFAHVRAIGLPVVYLPPRTVRRRPGSLLVMPAHSVDYTRHQWRFDEYAEAIHGIRGEFSEVVVCVHPSCWKHGYWVDSFRRRGFRVISGARADDRRAYERMRYLMSRFEHVTTNGFGSHLAYAAYWGAKPSVFGPYAEYRAEDYRNDPIFRLNPELLEVSLRTVSEEYVRRNTPQLFCHPAEARADVAWGRFEVGEQHKVSPWQLRRLFGWSAWGRLKHEARPRRLKHWARVLVEPAYRGRHREEQRLLALPPGQAARAELLGQEFELLDGREFLAARARVVERGTYRFLAARETPRILDCGANVGVAVAYFKHLYPKGEILAFEPVPQVCDVLRRNASARGEGVRVLPQAVWHREGTLHFATEGGARWRLTETPWREERVVEAPACRLRDFLTEKVDLLRLNIGGAELEVLRDCEDLLANVEHLAVDHHSFAHRPQRLDELLALLTRAGFRLHLHTAHPAGTPFLYRPVFRRMDSLLTVFAFRG